MNSMSTSKGDFLSEVFNRLSDIEEAYERDEVHTLRAQR